MIAFNKFISDLLTYLIFNGRFLNKIDVGMIGVWTGVLWVVSYGGVFCFMDGVLWG
jgi:hypothetical protein